MDGRVLADVNVEDASTLVRGIMQIGTLTLIFKSDKALEFGSRDYVVYEGRRYYLYRSPEVRKVATSWLEYTATFHEIAMSLDDILIKDESKPARTKFVFSGKPADFIRLIVRNMGDGWSVGETIDKEDQTIAFSGQSCHNALGVIAQTFETEWEVEGRRIHLRKVEHDKATPLPLSYGKGNGFVSGVSRIGSNDKQVGRLYVEGGERNIDPAKYKARALMLPKAARLEYQGRTYRTDADGTYVYRQGSDVITQAAVALTQIYPKRVGTLTGVTVVDESKHFYDVVDTSIPADLDYSKYRIPGQKAVIKFESGMLAGREFEIKQTDKALTGYHHDTRRFEVVPQEIDDIVMPGGVFIPRVGDKYAIFNIDLPEAYTRAAADELFREAVKQLADRSEPMYEFGGKLDAVWSTRRWLEIGGKIKPGGHVLFSDAEFHPGGTVIRIVSVTQHLNNPTAPEMTLSNTTVSGSFGSTISKLEAQEVLIDKGIKDMYKYSERQWQHVKETQDALKGMADQLGYDKPITPILAQMMQLIVGDERLQYRFVRSRGDLTPVVHEITHKVEGAQLIAPEGTIQHMTIGIDAISSAHTGYKVWDVARYESPALERKKTYYLYIKAPISGTSATYRLETAPIAMDADAGYYNLLVGLSVDGLEGRSFARLHGFTEILPGRITTPRLVSPDGRDYVDFEGKRYHFGWDGGYLDINSMGDGKTRLKGALITVGDKDTSLEDYIDSIKPEPANPYTPVMYVSGSFRNNKLRGLSVRADLIDKTGYVWYGADKLWRYRFRSGGDRPEFSSWEAQHTFSLSDRSDAREYLDIEVKLTLDGYTSIATSTLPNVKDGKDGKSGNPYTSLLTVQGSWRNDLVRGVVAKARVVDTTGYEWFGAETFWRYRYRSSSSTPGFGEWEAGRSTLTIPDTTNTGDYLDIECKQVYNGFTSFSSYSLSNVKDGDPGSPGDPGRDGKGVESVVKEWAKTTDPDNPPSEGSPLWSAIPPKPEPGKYIWERTTTTYTQGAPSRTTPIRVELTGVSKALAEAFETSTEIKGGLVATTMLLVRNALGKIRAYFSGSGNKTNDIAFAAGVENFGLPNETQATYIKQNGDAKFGEMYMDANGQVYAMRDGKRYFLLGGAIPTLEQLIAGEGDDVIANGRRNYFWLTKTASPKVYTLSDNVTVKNAGASIIISGMVELLYDINTDDGSPGEGYPNWNAKGQGVWANLYLYKGNAKHKLIKSYSLPTDYNVMENLFYPTIVEQPGTYSLRVEVSFKEPNRNQGYMGARYSGTVRGYFVGAGDFSHFGDDGMAISRGKGNFLHFDTNGLKIGEKTSFPGVLCAGVVERAGGVSKHWGAHKYWRDDRGLVTNRVKAELLSTGTYKVYHTIGHSNYIPMLTPYKVRSMAMDVYEISDYYFVVRCWDTRGKELWSDGFTYVCFGQVE